MPRNTKQKQLLSQEVEKFKSFFTAEDLLAKATKKDSRIGIATVYRFLKDLINKRKVHSYNCNRRTIYSTEDKSHCHFICEKCGKIKHIPMKKIDFISESLKEEVCHIQIDVNGICKDCSSLSKNS